MIAIRKTFAASTAFAPEGFARQDDCMSLIKDVVDHLSESCRHCHGDDEASTRQLLASVRRDVHEIQRLCNRLDVMPAERATDSVALAL